MLYNTFVSFGPVVKWYNAAFALQRRESDSRQVHKIFDISMKPILVTCYVNPDLDGVSGSVAYAEFLQKMGKIAVVGIFGEPHEEAKYILNRFAISYPQELPDAHGLVNTLCFSQKIDLSY